MIQLSEEKKFELRIKCTELQESEKKKKNQPKSSNWYLKKPKIFGKKKKKALIFPIKKYPTSLIKPKDIVMLSKPANVVWKQRKGINS